MTKEEQTIWFEAFCRQEYVALYRYAYAHTGQREDASEVVQESFLSFYQLLMSGEVRGHERALLFRMARNKSIDVVRRRVRRRETGEEATEGRVLHFRGADGRTPEEVLLEKERRRVAEQALARLSERDRECLALRGNGLTNQEVAAVLQVTPVTVRQIISRALRRFGQVYEELLRDKGRGGTDRDRTWPI
ncbi:MAG: RNA polymerase sigma factor [Blastocatellia bacterium]